MLPAGYMLKSLTSRNKKSGFFVLLKYYFCVNPLLP